MRGSFCIEDADPPSVPPTTNSNSVPHMIWPYLQSPHTVPQPEFYLRPAISRHNADETTSPSRSKTSRLPFTDLGGGGGGLVRYTPSTGVFDSSLALTGCYGPSLSAFSIGAFNLTIRMRHDLAKAEADGRRCLCNEYLAVCVLVVLLRCVSW